MSVSHGFQHLYVGGLAVAYPFVVAEFHVSYALLGALLTAAGLLGGLLQGAAGLIRRFSTAAILCAQDLGLAIASWFGATAPGFWPFGGARMLGAAVSWPQHPVGSAYLTGRFPHRRATVLSWHVAGGSVGTVVAPLFVSVVIVVAGWRWALAALGCALAVGGLLIQLALPSERLAADAAEASATDRADPAREEPTRADRGRVPTHQTLSLRQLLSRRRVVAVLVASTIAAGGRGLGTLSTYIPAYLRSGLHMSALTVGTLFTIVMAASIVGPVVGGHLADRFGRARTLIVTYLAAAAVVTAFGYAGRGFWALAVLGACVGVLAYTESPLLQALFADLTEDGSARSSFGLFFALAYGIGSVWMAIIGWVITRAGFPAAFATMAASFVAAAIVIAVFVGTGRQEGKPG